MRFVARAMIGSGLCAAAALGVVGLRPAAAADYGTIKGRLVWGGADAPKPAVLVKSGDVDKKDYKVCASKGDLLSRELVVDPKTKGVEFGIAYLTKPKGTNPEAEKALVAKAAKVEIDQQSCEFIPHTSAVFKSQPVVFKSSDPVPHNVRCTGFNNALNVALPPRGQVENTLRPEARALVLNCDIHPWMTGKVMVFDHPFFAVTKPDGSFEIRGVPAGPQTLIVYHEKVGFVTPNRLKGQAVTVKAGAIVDVGDIKLDPATVK